MTRSLADDRFELAATAEELRKALSAGWPTELASQLIAESAALARGEVASLPYVAIGAIADESEVAWVTIAPTADSLQAAVEDLRAWVLPSLAWEDRDQPFAAPSEARGRHSDALIRLSPAGYYRWRSRRGDIPRIVAKLVALRRLLARRPAHATEKVPSLVELRGEFAVALLTGDRTAADDVVRAIDRYQLDAALNTRLMRIEMFDRFREYDALVSDPHLDRVLRVRLPVAARVALMRAFYEVYVSPAEATGGSANGARAYADLVHARVGSLVALAGAADGPEVARCVAYRAVLVRDTAAARAVRGAVDAGIADLLEPLLDSPQAPLESDAANQARVAEALRVGDAHALQAAGLALIAAGVTPGATSHPELWRALHATLDIAPNEALRDALVAGGRGPSEPAPSESVTLPQSWREFRLALVERRWAAARAFLESEVRPDADALQPGDLEAVAEALDELYTGGASSREVGTRQVAAACTTALVEDLVRDVEFPRPERSGLYAKLLRLWVDGRRGSANTVDGHVTLTLAGAVLEREPSLEGEVAELLRGWWEARPARALLPFALQATELLAEKAVAQHGVAQGLWVDAVARAGEDPTSVTQGEATLWRRVGRRLGFTDADAESYLGAVSVDDTDVLATGLTKVAIVSLHEGAARQAGEIIRTRSGADVVIVTEKVAGAATHNAKTADVVLFVWAASKHAVFRAFDDCRERLAYVPGTGASSIILTLERWATDRALTSGQMRSP